MPYLSRFNLAGFCIGDGRLARYVVRPCFFFRRFRKSSWKLVGASFPHLASEGIMALKSFLAGMALAVLALPLSASATLGGDVASVWSDVAQMSASTRMTTAAAYTLFENQTPSGTLIREYVAPSGLVFAIVWDGPSLPDLRQLLGSYFAKFVQAQNAQGGGAGARLIEQPGLVVYAGGHMRAFHGRALVPDLVPKGVSLDEIR